jgi:hypothetical protein
VRSRVDEVSVWDLPRDPEWIRSLFAISAVVQGR